MKNVNLSDEAVLNITNSIVEFLKTRITFTQRLRATYPSDRLIDLDVFVEKYSRFNCEIEASSEEELDSLYERLHEFEKKYSDGVVIDEKQIDDLLDLVRTAIVGVRVFADHGYSSHDESSLIFMYLREFKEKVESSDVLIKLEYWWNVLFLLDQSYIGLVNSQMRGSISLGCVGDDIIVSADDHSGNNHCRSLNVFSYDVNGKLLSYAPLESENFLIADDLFIGYCENTGDYDFQGIFLKKVVDGVEYGYGIGNGLNVPIEDNITYVESFTEYCVANGVGDMCKMFYQNVSEIFEIEQAILDFKKDGFVRYEKISGIAADWWVDAIRSPNFDNGDSSGIGFVVSMLANNLASSMIERISDDDLELFRQSLVKRIQPKLLSMGRCELSVDYDPCVELYQAAREAGIEVQFPWRQMMIIENGVILVKSGHYSDFKQIYAE